MNKLKLPYFKEEIDIHNLQDEYETELMFNDKTVDVFLNEMQFADKEHFFLIKSILGNLSKFDKQNRGFIEEDFQDTDGVTFEYLSYHLEELKEDFESLINSNNHKVNILKKLMKLLKIKTISFYANLVVFDYCLDEELSDQLLVVKMNQQKTLSLDWKVK